MAVHRPLRRIPNTHQSSESPQHQPQQGKELQRQLQPLLPAQPHPGTGDGVPVPSSARCRCHHGVPAALWQGVGRALERGVERVREPTRLSSLLIKKIPWGMQIPRLPGLCGSTAELRTLGTGVWSGSHPCPHPHTCPSPTSDAGGALQPPALPAGGRPGCSLALHHGKGTCPPWCHPTNPREKSKGKARQESP